MTEKPNQLIMLLRFTDCPNALSPVLCNSPWNVMLTRRLLLTAGSATMASNNPPSSGVRALR